MKLYLSKVNDLYKCPRLFKYKYIDFLAPKEEPSYLRVGRALHKVQQLLLPKRKENEMYQTNHYLVPGVEEAIDSLPNEEEKTLVSSLASTLNTNFPNTYEVVGTEQLYSFSPLNLMREEYVWYSKVDILLKKDKELWIGETKTTSGYGPSLQTLFHRDLQTAVYALTYMKQTNEKPEGVVAFILTKTKIPNLYVEEIPLSLERLTLAEKFVKEACSFLAFIMHNNFFVRNLTNCFSWGKECIYTPLCYSLSPKKEYEEEVKNSWYIQKDPDEHLFL